MNERRESAGGGEIRPTYFLFKLHDSKRLDGRKKLSSICDFTLVSVQGLILNPRTKVSVENNEGTSLCNVRCDTNVDHSSQQVLISFILSSWSREGMDKL